LERRGQFGVEFLVFALEEIGIESVRRVRQAEDKKKKKRKNLDDGLVRLMNRELVVVKVYSSGKGALVHQQMETERKYTHTTVRKILSESIFFTVASQSSISIGLSPFVTSTILRVHVRLFARYSACVSIPTISASIA
jgi:hypothetical protein